MTKGKGNNISRMDKHRKEKKPGTKQLLFHFDKDLQLTMDEAMIMALAILEIWEQNHPGQDVRLYRDMIKSRLRVDEIITGQEKRVGIANRCSTDDAGKVTVQ